ncbi:uncharacterized protein PG998_006397 [Apiospora kogelbergensis]|uniref:uncharacterized protein n=1 Tax=Apiospora kogelbergensis TaxID=1337665 RepID=UPI00312F84CA
MAGVAPGKTYTPGLGLSGVTYTCPAKKAESDAERAHKIIQEKLPVLSQINVLFTVTFGDRPTFFVDGRSDEAKILDSCNKEPECRLNIKPEYIIQFYENKPEPRYGDAFFNEASKPSGKIPVAIRSFSRLLKATEDINQVKRDIEEFGYGLAKNFLSPEQLLKSTESQMGDDFLDLLNHPIIDEFIPWFLGEHAITTTYTANIARPGSHLGQVAPEDIFTVEGTVPAEAPAGTALIIDSCIWHATGPNREAAGERPVILLFFMRSFVRQQENNFLSLRRNDVWPKLSDRHKRMLGFYTTGALGGVDGEVCEGVLVEWRDSVGEMRAPNDRS